LQHWEMGIPQTALLPLRVINSGPRICFVNGCTLTSRRTVWFYSILLEAAYSTSSCENGWQMKKKNLRNTPCEQKDNCKVADQQSPGLRLSSPVKAVRFMSYLNTENQLLPLSDSPSLLPSCL
jgi:hypothetical protein